MAKRTNSFKCKGELVLEEGKVYEVKKDEIIPIPFFQILREFDGKTISISITEETEFGSPEDEEEI